MKKTKIILLQGLLFFITATQLPAAQKELLDAGSSSSRHLDDASSHSLFAASSKEIHQAGDSLLSLDTLKKKVRDSGTQTDPKTITQDALDLLTKAGNTMRSHYDFGRFQDTVTAAAVVSLGLRAFGNRSIGGTKIDQLFILTGVLEGVAASYAMTREGSRHKEWLPASVLSGLSTCAVFAKKGNFTEPYWGNVFGLFALGSGFGTAVYQGLRWLKKPSIRSGVSFGSDNSGPHRD